MKSNKKVEDAILKSGITEREFAEKVQSAKNKSCLLCGSNEPIYVGISIDGNKMPITYTLCTNCFKKLQENEKKQLRIIERQLKVNEEKRTQDKKWDIGMVN